MNPRLFHFLFGCLVIALARDAAAQGTLTPPLYAFSHLAGSPGGYGNADGPVTTARFWNPAGIAVDSAGNLYVADFSANSVRRVSATGTVTTVLTAREAASRLALGSFRTLWFRGVAVDAFDNLFIADGSIGVILKLTTNGTLSIHTGQVGLRLFPSKDGPLAEASFNDPAGLAVDAAGNLFVADPSNHIIRKISPQGQVTTHGGTPPAYQHPQGAGVDGRKMFPGSADGPALSAQFNFPMAVAADLSGNVFVADTENHTVRKIGADGLVTTLAGRPGEPGSRDGLGGVARFRYPQGVAVDAAGVVYVADTGNGTIRRISPAGDVTTLAGLAGDSRSVDGPGTTARFVAPKGLWFDRRAGRLLVGDGSSRDNPELIGGTLRQVSTEGVVATLAGQAGASGSTDGRGTAARFRFPADVAVDAAGNVFVADDFNHTIRKIAADGTTSTFAGSPGVAGAVDGAGSAARFNHPVSLAFDGSGRLIVVDQGNHVIRRITPDGVVSTLAGTVGIPGTVDGPAGSARFAYPSAVAVDGSGTIYIGDGDYFPSAGDPATQYATIRKLTPAGEVTTLAGNPAIVPYEQTRLEWDGTGAGARFGLVSGLAADAAGNLYACDYRYGRIRRVTPQGVVTTLALTDANGAALGPRYFSGITRDQEGNLYVTDSTDARYTLEPASALIQRITPGGTLTTLAGVTGVKGSADGVGPAAHFNQPAGLEIDAQGTLYIADTDNHAIRKGIRAGPPVITTQPQSLTVAAGGTVQFSVAATGVPDPSYQWHFNGNPFAGATSASLSLTNVRASDAGNYTVVVSNAAGSVTSSVATLAVTAAPATPAPAAGGGGGGAPSLWFLGGLALLRLLHVGWRRAGR